MKILVTAASSYGATREIAAAIGDVLAERGFETTVAAPDEVGSISGHDAFVIGSAVYTGHWLKDAKRLVERSRADLAGRPVWLFSSGPVGDPSRKLVQQMGADPVDLAALRSLTHARDHQVFAGKLDRQNLTLPQRAMLIAFRGMEGDFRDWDAIRAWATGIADSLREAA